MKRLTILGLGGPAASGAWACAAAGAGNAAAAATSAATTGARNVTPPRLRVLIEVQRAAVDAETLAAAVARPVVEDVSEVAAAVGAQHLGAAHPVRTVLAQRHGVGDGGLGEARPAGAGLEL